MKFIPESTLKYKEQRYTDRINITVLEETQSHIQINRL